MIWEQTTLGVQEGGASGEAVFLQTPQPDRGPSVYTAYGGMDKAQALGPDSLGYLTRTSHYYSDPQCAQLQIGQ